MALRLRHALLALVPGLGLAAVVASFPIAIDAVDLDTAIVYQLQLLRSVGFVLTLGVAAAAGAAVARDGGLDSRDEEPSVAPLFALFLAGGVVGLIVAYAGLAVTLAGGSTAGPVWAPILTQTFQSAVPVAVAGVAGASVAALSRA